RRKYIQFGNDQSGNTIDHDTEIELRQIQPPTASGTPRCRSEFVTEVLQFMPVFIEQFGWKWPAAYPGAIRFCDADDFADFGWGYTQSATHSATRGVGRGDVGISSVFDIEHGALGSLSQNGLIVGQCLIE